MKLTIEHLAPYLPYGLECIANGNKVLLRGLYEGSSRGTLMIQLWKNYKKTINIISGTHYEEYLYYSGVQQVKPILRPMSDLLVGYSVLGEDKSIIAEIKSIGVMNYNLTPKDWDMIFYMIRHCENPIIHPYWIVNLLIKYHFDVFGLIEQGLALNINEI